VKPRYPVMIALEIVIVYGVLAIILANRETSMARQMVFLLDVLIGVGSNARSMAKSSSGHVSQPLLWLSSWLGSSSFAAVAIAIGEEEDGSIANSEHGKKRSKMN